MGGWLALIDGRWKLYLLVGLAFMAGLIGLRLYWLETRVAQERAYRKTRERIDDAEVHGDDPAAARRWLHERGSRGPL